MNRIMNSIEYISIMNGIMNGKIQLFCSSSLILIFYEIYISSSDLSLVRFLYGSKLIIHCFLSWVTASLYLLAYLNSDDRFFVNSSKLQSQSYLFLDFSQWYLFLPGLTTSTPIDKKSWQNYLKMQLSLFLKLNLP